MREVATEIQRDNEIGHSNEVFIREYKKNTKVKKLIKKLIIKIIRWKSEKAY